MILNIKITLFGFNARDNLWFFLWERTKNNNKSLNSRDCVWKPEHKNQIFFWVLVHFKTWRRSFKDCFL